MRNHTVTVDTSTTPTSFQFAPVFNVAVPFIDRHLKEGRTGKPVIHTQGREITYGFLASNVNRCGNALLGLGIGAGDRVIMVVKDSPEFYYLFWGAIKAGIVPVPINTLLRAKDFAFMIEDAGCKAVIYSPDFAGEVEPALGSAAHKPEHILRVMGGGEDLFSLMGEASPDLDPAPTSPDDDCFWLYSSGTTGNPKGAVHHHRSMVVTSQCYGVETIGFGKDDISFSAAKLFFAYGLGNAMTFPLWVGGAAILFPGRPTPETTFDHIEQLKPTLFFGVPTLYAAQLKALEHMQSDLSSLRLCISAGEALPPDILKRWKDRTGLTVIDGIGTTEILHIFISNRADEIKPGSTGRMVGGYEAKVVDEDGNPVKKGDSGRLMVKGDSLLKYYWNNPEKTAATLIDGWLNTGDTYYQDEDGFFFCAGRSDDMMKVGGIWCSPVEIEARLVEHPKVLEAAVVGRADDEGLIKPEAHVVLAEPEDDLDGLAEELLHHCKDGLARYKYPRWFNFIDELPKTATGKIQRFKLRQT